MTRLYLTFWSLQRAPPQEWCCSCWWNRNQPWGPPPRDGLASHPYRQKTKVELANRQIFTLTTSHFVAVNLNLGFSERFKTHMVQKWHSLACAVALDVSTQTYRVKTPAARPIVVSLALCSTSTSVSKDSTDMTGPKISSFTQVISSVQSPIRGGKKKGQECRNTDVTSRITYLKCVLIVMNLPLTLENSTIVCNTVRKNTSCISSECTVFVEKCMQVLPNTHGVM